MLSAASFPAGLSDVGGTNESRARPRGRTYTMFAKLAYTWELMGASWRVLKKDREILVFPLLSGICCLIVLASFAFPMYTTDHWRPRSGATQAQQAAYYALLFAFYFCNYFVITFFNTAIVACAVSRMSGGDPTVAGGFREAIKRIHLIAGWALVSATVGLILRIIEERSEKVGRFVAGLLGSAWTIMTFLVVPVLVVENKGPFAALGESTKLLRKTWGEQLVGNFSFGAIFTLLALPGIGVAVLGFYVWKTMHNGVTAVLCVVIAIVYMIVLSLIQSALSAIFQAAVYMHTQGAIVDHGPQGFPVQLLNQAMSPRRGASV
jgi:hypothetical protein